MQFCDTPMTPLFWKERFETSGVRLEDLKELDDLRKLPLLTKEDLRNHLDKMISSRYADVSRLTKHTTSGSTGVPVVVYSDEQCDQVKRGAVLRSDEWTGWRLGERVASLWGNPQVRRDWKGVLRNWLLERRYVYLDTLKMDEAAINVFVDALVRTPPSLLFGHAHSLYLLAGFLKSKRPEIRIRPHGILSTCMVLHHHERALIEEVFGTQVTNRYGCEEVSLIASDCEKHEGLHVNSDCVYVELIDSHGHPCKLEQPGRVVVTDLWNWAMPLIRYEVGDTASWSSQPCSCGRTLPLLSRIEGRIADYVVTDQGESISGISLTENFACLITGIAQLQIIQEDINKFTFNIVKGADFGDESLNQIRDQVHKRFGAAAQFECVYVHKIEPDPSGKYRFCISKVKKEF